MEKIEEQLKKKVSPDLLVKILKIIGVFIIAVTIFASGVNVGFREASFGRNWGEHYNENFGLGMRNTGMMGVRNIGMTNYFPNAHGATGEIIRTELPNIIVEDRENTEKSILIGTDTRIQKGSDMILSTDLRSSDFVVVIGSPNGDGVIEAKLIRVLPNPELLK